MRLELDVVLQAKVSGNIMVVRQTMYHLVRECKFQDSSLDNQVWVLQDQNLIWNFSQLSIKASCKINYWTKLQKLLTKFQMNLKDLLQLQALLVSDQVAPLSGWTLTLYKHAKNWSPILENTVSWPSKMVQLVLLLDLPLSLEVNRLTSFLVLWENSNETFEGNDLFVFIFKWIYTIFKHLIYFII